MSNSIFNPGNQMEYEKLIPEKMLRAVTVEGFEELVFDLLPRFKYRYDHAFEAANEMYYAIYRNYRYSDYASYKSAKSKRLKKVNQVINSINT